MQQAPLLIDIAGTRLGTDDRRRLAHPLVGGLILFARNWQDRVQLTNLCADVKRLRPDLVIGVDHEGGRVQRFRSGGFTCLPTMRTLGEQWMRDPMRAQDVATACGLVLASELRACGIDWSFAPVLDLDWGHSGVIGDRAFHADPRVVTLLAKGLMHGMLLAGMANCGKHFPGHGFAAADSHIDLPRDRRLLSAILRDDAAPYGWLRSVLTAVMPAHVIYTRVDRRPAGFSRRWLQAILRERIGFSGAIISDDLSMAAARQIDGRTITPAQAVLAALDAGCDLALLCNQSLGDGQLIDDTIEQLARAQVDRRWLPSTASEQRRRALLSRTPALTWDELMLMPAYLQALECVP